MKYLALMIGVCYFITCPAVVIENKNGVVKVDKWGKKKIECCKFKTKDRPKVKR